MRWRLATVAAALLTLLPPASAHRIDEYLQATVLSVESTRTAATMRVIPGVTVASATIAAIDRNGDGVFSPAEQRAFAEATVASLQLSSDGVARHPRLQSFRFPQPEELRGGSAAIEIEYVVDLPGSAGEHTLVLVQPDRTANFVYLVNALMPQDGAIVLGPQRRDARQTRYELHYTQAAQSGVVGTEGSSDRLRDNPFAGLFHLGMRHIAEGTDHVLFLLALLLPAPLVAEHGQWKGAAGLKQSVLRILRIVTAFTIGHSLTLALATFQLVRVPGRTVEALIAVSILVSAAHALYPFLQGKEAAIACFFGLIHGLAFAATLENLGLERWQRLAGLLAFNAGIEAMQLVVVVLVLPSLLLLSRTRAYSGFRIAGACFAGVAAIGWLAERTLGVALPVDRVVDGVVRYGLWDSVLLFALALACWYLSDHRWHARNPV